MNPKLVTEYAGSPVEAILKSNGKFFTVTFTKKDGTTRVMNGRMGVTRHLKGGDRTTDPETFIMVYDVQAKGYRAVNKAAVSKVEIDGQTITWTR